MTKTEQWEQQQQNSRTRTDSSLSHFGGGGGLNAFNWCTIFVFNFITAIELKELRIIYEQMYRYIKS